RSDWLRPSKRPSRLTLPLGPSNSYFFSTAIHGIRRRSAASASRERVKAFSFKRSCCRAASHSCSDTIAGVFIATFPFGCSLSLSLSLLVAIRFLLFRLSFLKQVGTTRSEKFSELPDAHRQNSCRRASAGDHYCCVCDACWAHLSILRTRLSRPSTLQPSTGCRQNSNWEPSFCLSLVITAARGVRIRGR